MVIFPTHFFHSQRIFAGFPSSNFESRCHLANLAFRLSGSNATGKQYDMGPTRFLNKVFFRGGNLYRALRETLGCFRGEWKLLTLPQTTPPQDVLLVFLKSPNHNPAAWKKKTGHQGIYVYLYILGNLKHPLWNIVVSIR